MKHVTAIDNPINGYVEGHSDSEDLGIFVLSPETIWLNNTEPRGRPVWLWSITDNTFDPSDLDFYDRKH